MKKIIISQRTYIASYNLEIRDCLDRKWYNISDEIGCILNPIANNPTMVYSYLNTLKPDAVILSGGNSLSFHSDDDISVERDKTEAKILDWAIENNIPVLGVCRGMQMINYYFGGTETAVKDCVATKQKIINISGYDFDITVNSYHNYGITADTISKECDILAKTDNIIKALKVKHKKIWGIMWHPERNSHISKKDINFIRKVLDI